jgi:hypothetical protein
MQEVKIRLKNGEQKWFVVKKVSLSQHFNLIYIKLTLGNGVNIRYYYSAKQIEDIVITAR